MEPASAVSLVTGDGQLSLSALGQLRDTLVPALDDLALANLALEGLATVSRGVKLLAVVKSTGVVDGDEVALLGEGLTVAFLDDVDLSGGGHDSSSGVKKPSGRGGNYVPAECGGEHWRVAGGGATVARHLPFSRYRKSRESHVGDATDVIEPECCLAGDT